MTGRSPRWGRRFAGLALLLLVFVPGAASAATRTDASARPSTITAAHAVDLATVPALPRVHSGHALTRSPGGTLPVVAAATLALLVALGCSLASLARARRAATVVARTRRERAPPSRN